MRVIFALLISILLALAVFFFVQPLMRNKIPARTAAKAELLRLGINFINALAQKDGVRIYRMFNSTFQSEVPMSKLQAAIDRWYGDNSFKGVRFGAVNIFGLSGHITSWVSFQNSFTPKFISQYWIKTDQGWRLMWLSGILNHRDFNYGERDTIAQKEIMQLMLVQAIDDFGTEIIFPEVELSNNLAILIHPDRMRLYRTKIGNFKNRIFWLTQNELEEGYRSLKINTYFDFGMVRVMDEIAIGALDIVPIPSAVPRPKFKRRHSVSMFFKKEAGEWAFAGYGSKW